MATKLIERTARFLETKLDRRGFLARGALAGTAVAVAPSEFILRPNSAYAAICNCNGSSCSCSATCCDGYTEFCCHTHPGNGNRCPPGTRLGGWWKVDGSNFCGGGPRYYMDCNAACGSCGCGGSGICSGSCSGTGCGCAHGDCGNRKSGCTGFRYGQCNNQIACLGPIVCRVVTCTAPWAIDPSCSTTVRVDEATRYHNRPCLQQSDNPFGAVDFVSDEKGALRLRGWIIDPNTGWPAYAHIYVDGAAVASTLAKLSRPDVARRYPAYGAYHGFDITVPMSTGLHVVCVAAINHGPGNNQFLGCAFVYLSPEPFGALDLVQAKPGATRITGWAADPDKGTAPISVHTYVDGRLHSAVRADRYRPDIERIYPHLGPYHGFDATLPTSGGDHEVCVYAINDGSGHNQRLACKKVGRPFGNLDVVRDEGGAIRVSGWAIDPDTVDPIKVHIYIDGHATRSLDANRSRPDVEGVYPGYGPNHGFNDVVPAGRGEHVVCVFAISYGRGSAEYLGWKKVVVA